MQQYKVMADFGGMGMMPMIYSVVTAVPEFFSILLFFIFLLGSASSYYAMLKLTGRKRFWNALTAMSFVTFILSLLVSAMNTATINVLSGYWVGFYIMMTLVSWFMLSKYK